MASLEDLNDEQRLGYAKIAHSALTHSDPKIRREAKKLVKSLNPTWADPELEAEAVEDRIMAKVVQPLRDEFTAYKDKTVQEKANAEWESSLKRIEATGIKRDDVQKVMIDRKIADIDTAAEFIRMQNQIATPSSPNGTVREMAPDVQKLLHNKQGLINHRRSEAHKAIEELNAMHRTGVRPVGFG